MSGRGRLLVVLHQISFWQNHLSKQTLWLRPLDPASHGQPLPEPHLSSGSAYLQSFLIWANHILLSDQMNPCFFGIGPPGSDSSWMTGPDLSRSSKSHIRLRFLIRKKFIPSLRCYYFSQLLKQYMKKIEKKLKKKIEKKMKNPTFSETKSFHWPDWYKLDRRFGCSYFLGQILYRVHITGFGLLMKVMEQQLLRSIDWRTK